MFVAQLSSGLLSAKVCVHSHRKTDNRTTRSRRGTKGAAATQRLSASTAAFGATLFGTQFSQGSFFLCFFCALHFCFGSTQKKIIKSKLRMPPLFASAACFKKTSSAIYSNMHLASSFWLPSLHIYRQSFQ